MFDSFVITISYRDYTVSNGGTDKYLLSHQKIFNNNRISVIHIFPIMIKKFCEKEYGTHLWGFLIDGKKQEKEIYTTRQVCEKLYFLGTHMDIRAVLVHNLLFMNLNELSIILGKCQAKCFFLIHDFLTLCPQILEHTEKTSKYCNLEISEEERCYKCGEHSKTVGTANAVSSFFKKINDLNFIAPSEMAKTIWCNKYITYEKQTRVIPHQRIVGEYKDNLYILTEDQPTKIAFVGVGAVTKGWLKWIEAVQASIQNNLNYQFFHFGSVDKHYDFIKEISVDFRINNNAMIDALRSNNIDIVVLWSLCPETYSYTFYESFSANCFIITNDKSGNIAEQVKKIGNGIVANDESLTDVLMNEKLLRKRLNDFKKSKRYGPLLLEDNDSLEKEILCLQPGKITANTVKGHCFAETAFYIMYYRLKQAVEAILHYHS